jgi:hypothetical protein
MIVKVLYIQACRRHGDITFVFTLSHRFPRENCSGQVLLSASEMKKLMNDAEEKLKP